MRPKNGWELGMNVYRILVWNFCLFCNALIYGSMIEYKEL